jgi:hypothetical protein
MTSTNVLVAVHLVREGTMNEGTLLTTLVLLLPSISTKDPVQGNHK